MNWYVKQNDTWTEAASAPDDSSGLQIQASDPNAPPELRFTKEGQAFFAFSGVDPRPQTDTTHTVARVDPSSATGTKVFAVHTDANDLIFKDLRSDSETAADDEAIAQVQSALNEILIPVYIDDVVSDFSERVSGLVVLHTVQCEPDAQAWTYFRTSIFENGELALEDEHGSL